MIEYESSNDPRKCYACNLVGNIMLLDEKSGENHASSKGKRRNRDKLGDCGGFCFAVLVPCEEANSGHRSM